MPVLMYSKLPPNMAGRSVLLVDPMLATGGSCVAAIKVLVDAGAAPKDIVFVNIVSCMEGLKALQDASPEVRVVTSAANHKGSKNYDFFQNLQRGIAV